MKTIRLSSGEDLTTVLAENRHNTRFELEAGEYEVGSHRDFAGLDYVNLGRNCELIGSGQDRTVIQITAREFSAQHEFIAGSRTEACERIRVAGLTLICPSAFPTAGTVGLHVFSDGFEIEDVRVRNVRGFVPTDGVERFGAGFLANVTGRRGTPGTRRVRNVRVDLTGGPGRQYVSGFYIGTVDNGLCEASEIVVVNQGTALVDSAFAFNGGVCGRRWLSRGRFTRGIYCDEAGGTGTVITESDIQAEGSLMTLRGREGWDWRDICIERSRLTLLPCSGQAYCVAVELGADGAKPGAFDAIRIEDSTLRCLQPPGAKPVPAYYAGIDSPRTTNCGIFKCRFSVLRDNWKAEQLKAGVPAGAFILE